MAKVSLPVHNVLLSFYVHILDGDVPLLLSLTYMDRINFVYNNLQERLNHVEYNELTVLIPHF